MSARNQRGYSLVELLIGLTLTLLVSGSLAGMLVQNARINKNEQTTVELQAAARNSLSIIVQKLRGAGWDPMNAGLELVELDPDDADPNDADGVDDLEIFADLSGDGDLDDEDEQVRIRRTGDRIVWRRTADGPYSVLAVNITNDADGDGVPEPMFVPDATPSPSRLTVRITARSPAPDPVSKRYIRYTVSTEVVLRSRT